MTKWNDEKNSSVDFWWAFFFRRKAENAIQMISAMFFRIIIEGIIVPNYAEKKREKTMEKLFRYIWYNGFGLKSTPYSNVCDCECERERKKIQKNSKKF